MGLFDKLNKGPAVDQPFQTIDGGFSCSQCYVQADDAKYYFAQKLLIYVCPNGHKNVIEGFEL